MSDEPIPAGDSPTLPLPQESTSLIKNRYHVERELGRGGMGVVFFARDQHLHNRPVVIKVLRDIAPGEWQTKKFRQEIEALVRIEHPGVVGVFDAGEMPKGQLFVVMQFVEGVQLRSIIMQGPMELEKAARVLEQIGSALNAAHEKGILHCDLKPENIMLQQLPRGQQVVKLIDFGIAKIRDSQVTASHSTKIAGTIEYMAPEQLNGAPCVASDIFSLGAVAYEMLTGQKAFPAKSLLHLVEMHQSGLRSSVRILRPELPAGVDQVIGKALAYDLRDRYQNAVDFTDDLGKALRAAPHSDAVVIPTRSLKMPVIVLPILIAIAAAILLFPFAKPKPAPTPTRIVKKSVAPISVRELAYSIGHLKGDVLLPVALSGDVTFQSGDKIHLNLSSPQAGYLYVMDEVPGAKDEPDYEILYPGSNNRSETAENKEITIPLQFDQEKGTEKIWITYAKNAVAELEAVRRFSNPKDRGEIKDRDDAMTVLKFFANHPAKAVSLYEKDQNRMRLKAEGDLLIYELLLEHR